MITKKQKLLNIFEENKGRILKNNYPANIGFIISVEENNFDYKFSKKVFQEWARNKGILVNIINF